MRMFNKIFIAIAFACIPVCFDAYAAQTDATCKTALDTTGSCPAGCNYVAATSTCTACKKNMFSSNPDTECTDCPEDSESAQGETSCKCQPKDITGGTWAPDEVHITKGQCTYKDPDNISCDKPTDCCNGYHRDGEECISNYASYTDNTIADGRRHYCNNQYTTYAIQCHDGYFLNKSALSVCPSDSDKNLYHECVDRIPCSDDLKNCKSPSTSEGISGNITANPNGTDKNYSACECRTGDPTTIENGTAQQVCKWTSGTGTNTEWGNCASTEIISCDAGYCEYNDSRTCNTVPAGYYSAANDVKCNKCPAGATSAEGAIAKTQCYISSATQFSDKLNTKPFTLPLPDSIKLYFKQ